MNIQAQRGSSESFDGIQYLRAIAALMVVLHHAQNYFGDAGGWTVFGSRGVDIFFVISGFIMAHSTSRFDAAGSRGGQALDFWVRRFMRVVPLYWLALLYQNKGLIIRGNADAGLLADFAFLPRFSQKYPDQIWPSLVPGWTINYEMLFYLLFGLAFFFGSMRYIALLVAFAALLGAGAAFDFASAPLAFWTDALTGEFLLGVGVYFLYASRKSWAPPPMVAIAAVLVGFIGMAVPNGGASRVLADGPFAALIVWGGLYVGRLAPRQRILSLIGDASYSIYLVHLFTFVGGSYQILDAMGMKSVTPLHIIVALAVCTAAATLVGVLVHFVVEKPLQRLMLGLWKGRKRTSSEPIAANRAAPDHN